MKINPAFPPSRLTEPTRRAERDIYQAVEASPIPGRTLYEVKVTRHAAQVDLVVWAEARRHVRSRSQGRAVRDPRR